MGLFNRLMDKGADIASAGTVDLAAATGSFVHITGTTTITAFSSMTAGAMRVLVFDGILTLTHNATSLILPTGANITTAAGDVAVFVSEGSGNWRCVEYQRKDGTALAGGAALTKTDDTNVTLTLGGSPTTALLAAASLTLGWTGQLAASRGGTGVATASANTLFAGPTSGGAAAPSFRSQVVADIPALDGFTEADWALTDRIIKASSGHVNQYETMDRLLGYAIGNPGGRLTLTSGTAVTVSDVTSAGTIYYTPYTYNRIRIYDGTRWKLYTFTEKSLSVTAVNGAVKSIFIYDNAGTLTLTDAYWTNSTVTITIASPGVVSWTSHGLQNGDSVVLSTTGALPTGLTAGTTYFVVSSATNTFQLAATVGGTAINTSGSQSGTHTAYVVGVASGNTTADPRGVTTQDGVLVKSGDTAKLFLGVYKASGTNTVDDSTTKRFLWNKYNKEIRELRKSDSTSSWTYATATWRQARADTANQVEVVTGEVQYAFPNLLVSMQVTTVAAADASTALGVDQTTPHANCLFGYTQNANSGADSHVCQLAHAALGVRTYKWLELRVTAGTYTFYGTTSAGGNSIILSGIGGTIWG